MTQPVWLGLFRWGSRNTASVLPTGKLVGIAVQWGLTTRMVIERGVIGQESRAQQLHLARFRAEFARDGSAGAQRSIVSVLPIPGPSRKWCSDEARP